MYFRQRQRAEQAQSSAIWPPARKAEPPWRSNDQCAHASAQDSPGWCGDCMCPQLQWSGRCVRGPSQLLRLYSTAAYAHRSAPNESSAQVRILSNLYVGLKPFRKRASGGSRNGPPAHISQLLSIAEIAGFRNSRTNRLAVLSREEETQHGRHPSSPGGFVVGSAGYALEVQIFTCLPAVGNKPAVEQFGVLQGSLAFPVAYVQPDLWTQVPSLRCLIQIADYALVVPPDGRGENGQFSEGLGEFQ